MVVVVVTCVVVGKLWRPEHRPTEKPCFVALVAADDDGGHSIVLKPPSRLGMRGTNSTEPCEPKRLYL